MLRNKIIQFFNSAVWYLTHPAIWDTPPGVEEFLKDIIKDKVVCDLGCADGTIMAGFKKYAKEVIGIEIGQGFVKEAREKGLNVICGDYFNMTLPFADIYYIHTTAENVKRVIEILKNQKRKIILIIGGYDFDYLKLTKFTDLIFNFPHKAGNAEFKIQIMEID